MATPSCHLKSLADTVNLALDRVSPTRAHLAVATLFGAPEVLGPAPLRTRSTRVVSTSAASAASVYFIFILLWWAVPRPWLAPLQIDFSAVRQTFSDCQTS